MAGVEMNARRAEHGSHAVVGNRIGDGDVCGRRRLDLGEDGREIIRDALAALGLAEAGGEDRQTRRRHGGVDARCPEIEQPGETV